MLKLFEFWNRHPDLHRSDALRRSDEYAAAIAESLDDHVIRYVTNVAAPNTEAAPCDAIDEYWLDTVTVAALRAPTTRECADIPSLGFVSSCSPSPSSTSTEPARTVGSNRCSSSPVDRK